jgi:molybdenum-dependent DNA-binding transcriptional regulator ModE
VAPLERGGHVLSARATTTTIPTAACAPSDHRDNLARAEAMLPGFTAGLARRNAGWMDRVPDHRFPDRLPIFGAAAIDGVHVATGLGLARPALGAPGRRAPRLATRRRAQPLPRDPRRRPLAAALPVVTFADAPRPRLPLALFVRVAETRSITKAAQASHIALAAASRRIAQLEDQFGVQLLYRTAKGVELTPAGTAMLNHARQMLEKVGEMRAEISDYSKGVKGRGARAGERLGPAPIPARRPRRPSPPPIPPSASRSRRNAAARSPKRCRRAPPTSAS